MPAETSPRFIIPGEEFVVGPVSSFAITYEDGLSVECVLDRPGGPIPAKLIVSPDSAVVLRTRGRYFTGRGWETQRDAAGPTDTLIDTPGAYIDPSCYVSESSDRFRVLDIERAHAEALYVDVPEFLLAGFRRAAGQLNPARIEADPNVDPVEYRRLLGRVGSVIAAGESVLSGLAQQAEADWLANKHAPQEAGGRLLEDWLPQARSLMEDLGFL